MLQKVTTTGKNTERRFEKGGGFEVLKDLVCKPQMI
jgi:hypothetical protein